MVNRVQPEFLVDVPAKGILQKRERGRDGGRK